LIWRRVEGLAWVRNQLRALLEMPADLAELRVMIRDARVASEAALAHATRPRPRWAQLMILWNAPPRPGPVLELGERNDQDFDDPSLTLQSPPRQKPRAEQPAVPCCYTWSFDLNDPDVRSRGVSSESMGWPIPAGSWVVGSGCLLTQIFIGNELQDVESGIKGLPVRMLRLRDPVGVGMRLRAQVLPDEGREP
jgi:hypothetical protein